MGHRSWPPSRTGRWWLLSSTRRSPGMLGPSCWRTGWRCCEDCKRATGQASSTTADQRQQGEFAMVTSDLRLELLPAVDVSGGQAVQLVQGVAGTGGQFGDPWEAAKAWQDQGAEWIHLVDLDAAFGRGSNRELLAGIVARLDIKVEMSGGIRDAESLAAALSNLSLIHISEPTRPY